MALVFAVFALPAFVFARWLGDGRLPLAGGSGMTVRDKALLDSRLARLMRMVGLATLATAAGIASWGDDERRLSILVVVMVLAVNGLAAAFVYVVASSRRRARGGRG
ncbi:hypothetical protein WQ56_05035 [Luteimonas sp. FCS-9]|nr:hypothetical protein WQ56_05035 [Luteimonas sp. FCS-9]